MIEIQPVGQRSRLINPDFIIEVSPSHNPLWAAISVSLGDVEPMELTLDEPYEDFVRRVFPEVKRLTPQPVNHRGAR